MEVQTCGSQSELDAQGTLGDDNDGGKTMKYEDFKDGLWRTCSRFEFCGSFFYSSSDELANGRHPALTIKGVGPVTFPLTEYDAKRVISAATESSGDSWEVEPANIYFMNTKWKELVQGLVVGTICERLGVSILPFQRVHCEFEKLLIFRPGTRPAYPHGPPSKGSGTFANLVVIMPSPFVGGKISLTHQGLSRAVDVATNAKTSLSFIAWYADGVAHEVKHIESAHQLVLCFTLRVVHAANKPVLPHWLIPSLPDMTSEVKALRHLLLKWEDGKCEGVPAIPLVAFVLRKHYSKIVERGVKGLQGPDAYLACHLLPIAQDLGFTVCLANLTLTATGYGKGYLNRLKSGSKTSYGCAVRDNDSVDENTEMEQISWEEYELSDLVRIGGTKRRVCSYLPTSIDISGEAIVPLRPFEGQKPAERHICDMAWGEPVLEYKYRGSAIMLYRTEDEISISVSALGLDWAFRQLESFTTKPDGGPASDIEKFETAIRTNLDAFRMQTYKSESEKAAKLEHAVCFIGYAVLKKNRKLWNETFPHLLSADSTILECILIEAFEVFDFCSIQAGIDDFMKNTSDATVLTKIIRTILLCGKKKPATLPLHYRFYTPKETPAVSKKVHFDENALLDSVKEKEEKPRQQTASKFLFGESIMATSASPLSLTQQASVKAEATGEVSAPYWSMTVESLLVSHSEEKASW
ncbi:hypothetical protein H1R20_g11984, partial [Candolleomyces eurysporus]